MFMRLFGWMLGGPKQDGRCEAVTESLGLPLFSTTTMRCRLEKRHKGPHYAEKGSDIVEKKTWRNEIIVK